MCIYFELWEADNVFFLVFIRQNTYIMHIPENISQLVIPHNPKTEKFYEHQQCAQ